MHFSLRHLTLATACAIAITASIAVTSASATPDSVYKGPGIDEPGDLRVQTDGDGSISSYDLDWKRKVCGIPRFDIYFEAGGGYPSMVVGADGSFYNRFSFTYRYNHKKYRVRATDRGGFWTMFDDPAYNPDQVYFKQTVKVKRIKKGAHWCKATSHEWIGFVQ